MFPFMINYHPIQILSIINEDLFLKSQAKIYFFRVKRDPLVDVQCFSLPLGLESTCLVLFLQVTFRFFPDF